MFEVLFSLQLWLIPSRLALSATIFIKISHNSFLNDYRISSNITCQKKLSKHFCSFVFQNYTVPPRQLKPATLTEEQKKKNAYKEKEKYFFGDGFNYVGNFDPLPYDESSFIIRSASNNGLILFAKLKGEQYAKSYLLIEMVNGTIGLR